MYKYLDLKDLIKRGENYPPAKKVNLGRVRINLSL